MSLDMNDVHEKYGKFVELLVYKNMTRKGISISFYDDLVNEVWTKISSVLPEKYDENKGKLITYLGTIVNVFFWGEFRGFCKRNIDNKLVFCSNINEDEEDDYFESIAQENWENQFKRIEAIEMIDKFIKNNRTREVLKLAIGIAYDGDSTLQQKEIAEKVLEKFGNKISMTRVQQIIKTAKRQLRYGWREENKKLLPEGRK